MDQLLLPILMFGAIGLMMYFGMRKQKRQAAEVQRLQESVVPGARIMTTSGLHGTITAVADDTIELEIAPGVRTTWVRAAVRDVVVPAVDSDADTADDVDEEDYSESFDSDQVSVESDEGENRQTDIG